MSTSRGVRGIAAAAASIAVIALSPGLGAASGGQGGKHYTDRSLSSYLVSIHARAHRILEAELRVVESEGIHCGGREEGLTGSWVIEDIKIDDGRFRAVEEQDGFGYYAPFRVMFRGAIKGDVIRGAASLRFKSMDRKNGHPTGTFTQCWSGRSYGDPLVHFVARLR